MELISHQLLNKYCHYRIGNKKKSYQNLGNNQNWVIGLALR